MASKLYIIGAAFSAALSASVENGGKVATAFVVEDPKSKEWSFTVKVGDPGEGPKNAIAVVQPTKAAIEAGLAKVKKDETPKPAKKVKAAKGKRPQKAAAKKTVKRAVASKK